VIWITSLPCASLLTVGKDAVMPWGGWLTAAFAKPSNGGSTLRNTNTGPLVPVVLKPNSRRLLSG